MLDEANKKDLEWITEELVKSFDQTGYEKVVIIFDKGRMVHIVRETPLKPPSFFRGQKKSS